MQCSSYWLCNAINSNTRFKKMKQKSKCLIRFWDVLQNEASSDRIPNPFFLDSTAVSFPQTHGSTEYRVLLHPRETYCKFHSLFSQRKMACEIGKKTHLALPAALWWKVRSQPKQSRRLRPAHHPQTHSPNKDRSSAIAVYLGNDRNHHDGERSKKNLFTNPITQRILSFRRSGVESEPGLCGNQSGRYSFFEPIAFLSLKRSGRLSAEVNNHLTCLSCHLYIWIIVFGLLLRLYICLHLLYVMSTPNWSGLLRGNSNKRMSHTANISSAGTNMVRFENIENT